MIINVYGNCVDVTAFKFGVTWLKEQEKMNKMGSAQFQNMMHRADTACRKWYPGYRK